jgi:putative transposase
MFPKRPRLEGFPYTGLHRYSLTICTKDRQRLFTENELITDVLLTIRQFAGSHKFALFGYCFMPDHVHIVASATAENADLRKFVAKWKQRSGYLFRQKTGQFLWQPSYFDHVLRDEEETWRAVRYALENPVRNGLVENFADYPFSGSDVYSKEQLAEMWRERQD